MSSADKPRRRRPRAAPAAAIAEASPTPPIEEPAAAAAAPIDDPPPGPPRVPVRFLTVCLDAGLPEQSLTLYPADELRFPENGDIVVVFREFTQEAITFRAGHIRWYSQSDGLAPARDPNMPDPVKRLIAELRERSPVR